MQSFIISFNSVMPLFVLMILGFVLKSLRFFNDDFIRLLNRTAFTCLIPVLLFNNIYCTELNDLFHIKLIVFTLVAVFCIWIITIIISGFFKLSRPERGSVIQGIYRANFVLFGLPVIILLYGAEKAGVTSMLAAITVPLFNVLAVITLTIFGEGKASFKSCIRDIFTNPLIIGSVVGIAALLLKVHLPVFLETSISWISNMAIPTSLLVMGASLEITSFKKKLRIILASTAVRLLLIPTVMLSIAALMGFRNIDMATLVAVFSAPTAITSFPMAMQMKSDIDIACGIVVLTTMFSVFTMFFSLFVLQHLGLIIIY